MKRDTVEQHQKKSLQQLSFIIHCVTRVGYKSEKNGCRSSKASTKMVRQYDLIDHNCNERVSCKESEIKRAHENMGGREMQNDGQEEKRAKVAKSRSHEPQKPSEI